MSAIKVSSTVAVKPHMMVQGPTAQQVCRGYRPLVSPPEISAKISAGCGESRFCEEGEEVAILF